MVLKVLDLAALQYLWGKLKALIPSKTSELTNDSDFITIAATIRDWGSGTGPSRPVIAYGTFTPVTQGSGVTVTHNLGVDPKGAVIWITPNGRTSVDYDNTTPLTVGNMGIMSASFQNPAINNTNYITSEIPGYGEKSGVYRVAMRFGVNSGATAASIAGAGGITAMNDTTFTVTNHSSSFTVPVYTFNYIVWGDSV